MWPEYINIFKCDPLTSLGPPGWGSPISNPVKYFLKSTQKLLTIRQIFDGFSIKKSPKKEAQNVDHLSILKK
jgi:hypothetical protein